MSLLVSCAFMRQAFSRSLQQDRHGQPASLSGRTCGACVVDTARGSEVATVPRDGNGGQVSGAMAPAPGRVPDPAVGRLLTPGPTVRRGCGLSADPGDSSCRD
jgi:hypothetical protein